MPASTVYLLRHGRTALNAAGALRGLIDVPLDQVGETEAVRLGDLFAGVPLTAVVSSPLLRARATAAAVAGSAGAELRTDPRLRDRDYGRWAGRSRADVERDHGSVDRAPEVEKAASFAGRVCAAFDDVVAGAEGSVAIVAHDAVNRALLRERCVGLDDAVGQRTGCWNRLERAGGDWRAVVVDAVPGDGQRP